MSQKLHNVCAGIPKERLNQLSGTFCLKDIELCVPGNLTIPSPSSPLIIEEVT